MLPTIIKDVESQNQEHKKHVRFSENGKQVELISPNKQGIFKIKNSRVPIASSALRFEELQHIEAQIQGMQVMPDFGYEGDNFVFEQEGARNWKLLTDLIYDKDKYEWLRNHIKLRQIRKEQRDEDQLKKGQLDKKRN